jgi:hypothetical protein
VNARKFFGELKRRNVYKVAIAYAVVAWLLMQTVTQVFPSLANTLWSRCPNRQGLALGIGEAAPQHNRGCPFINLTNGEN